MGYIGAGISRFNTVNGLSVNADGPTVTGIKDEDNMASNSAVKLATQQSIKAYVDSQIGANNELSEVLANGNTTGGNNIAFGDSGGVSDDRLTFGDSADFQLYFNGSDAVISAETTNNMYVQSHNVYLRSSVPGAENGVTILGDGAVQLYHDNNQKLATTSGGIDVTGTVTADGLTVDGASVFNQAASDQSGGAAVKANGTAYGTNKSIHAYMNTSSSAKSLIYAENGAGSVFNVDGSGDISFYDSTGTTQGLFWDASTQRLGLGTTSPADKLDVNGTIRGTTLDLRIFTLDSTDTAIYNYEAAGTSSMVLATRYANPIEFRIADSEKMRIDSSGRVLIGDSNPDSTTEKLVVSGNGNNRPVRFMYDGNAGTYFDIDTNAANGTVVLRADARSGAYPPMVFETSATERMRIDNSGNVGIGRSSLNIPLEVKGRSADGRFLRGVDNGGTDFVDIGHSGSLGFIDVTHSGGAYHDFAINTGGSERMRITSAGNVCFNNSVANTVSGYSNQQGGGFVFSDKHFEFATNIDRSAVEIGKNHPNDGELVTFRKQGTVVGGISVSSSGTTYNTISDIRLKTDIQPITTATDKIMSMNAVTHKWKAEPEADSVHGFIAQEMRDILPEAVSGDPDGDDMMSMDYGRITPVVVAALQDAHKKIAELETRIKKLENK